MSHTVEGQETHKHWGRLGRSILNGVIGDYLEKECNPLAIQMGFYYHYKRLVLNEHLVHQLDAPLSNKVVVFVHGLTNLETVWDYHLKAPSEGESLVDHYIDSCFDYKGGDVRENYGTKLQEDFGYTPFYLRYNTGLSLEKNGRLLAKQLTQLHEAYPINIDELMLVGFSMGGLLLRHAQYCAIQTDMPWLSNLSKCMYLGTPHEGSPLEKFGHFSGEIVRHFPRDYISHWADWIDRRSEGIQDLKHGLKFFAPSEDIESSCASFYDQARHYFISGSVGKNEDSFISRVMGDSLVRQGSANPGSAPTHSQNAHFEGLPHIPLAHSDRVYQQIACWVDEDERRLRTRHAGKALDLINYQVIRKPYIPEAGQQDVSNQALLAGTIDFMASAYDKTVETVETVHYSIAEEPFYVMQKLPVVSQIAKPIEAVHRDILDIVYRSLRGGGKLVHRAAKLLTPDDLAQARPNA